MLANSNVQNCSQFTLRPLSSYYKIVKRLRKKLCFLKVSEGYFPLNIKEFKPHYSPSLSTGVERVPWFLRKEPSASSLQNVETIEGLCTSQGSPEEGAPAGRQAGRLAEADPWSRGTLRASPWPAPKWRGWSAPQWLAWDDCKSLPMCRLAQWL